MLFSVNRFYWSIWVHLWEGWSWFIQFWTWDIAFLALCGFTPPRWPVQVPRSYKWKLFGFFNVFIYPFIFFPTAVRRDEDKKIDRGINVLSWPCLLGQDLFLRFYGPRLCLGPWKRNKRTRLTSGHLDFTLDQLRVWIYFMQTHTNLAREDGTNCNSEPEICLPYRSIDFLYLWFGSSSVNFSTDHTSISSKICCAKESEPIV